MNYLEAMNFIKENTKDWKVTTHPDDYDPTDEELAGLVIRAYKLGVSHACQYDDGLESMGFGVHSND